MTNSTDEGRLLMKNQTRVLATLGVLMLGSLLYTGIAEAKQKWLLPFIETYPGAFRVYGCGVCHTNFSGPGAPVATAVDAAFPSSGIEVFPAPVSESDADSDSRKGSKGDSDGDSDSDSGRGGKGGKGGKGDSDGDSDSEALNPYGRAFERAGGERNPTRAFASIEQLDSDGDGTANVDEILLLPGFFPGFSCDSLDMILNAPPDIARLVDPMDVGCGLIPVTTSTVTVPAPTSTTVRQSTSTTSASPMSSTTSSTLPGDACSSPVNGRFGPGASDCLVILSAAVNLGACDPACICAPGGSLPVTGSDALICLRRSTGQEAALNCPCDPVGSTTTSTLRPVTTTTSMQPATTTSTTVPSAGNPAVGRDLYATRCAGCHRAGADDPSGFASDLAGDGGRLVPNLGAIAPAMSGLTLTEQEIADLAAYLDSL